MDATCTDPRAKPPCDLVLRGGITSGVIYPGTIRGLAESYRFVNVGGASAGAIAAGVTVAAEYGRQTGGRPEAFVELGKLATKVSGGPDSETSLPQLFTADHRFRLERRLLAWWLAGTGQPTAKAGPLPWLARRVDPRWWLPRLLVAVVALTAVVPLLTLVPVHHPLLAQAAVVFYAVLALAFLALGRLRRLLRDLPRTGFGLCPGANPDVAPTMAAHRTEGWLADWLHATIQDLAGRTVGQVPARTGDGVPDVPAADRPLTVGDLWGLDEPSDPTRRLNLVLTTTNLSHQLPHGFPFVERPSGELYFRPEELRRVLPLDVVRWLTLKAQEVRDDGLYRLPRPADLPVLLGVRLSLSFPGLIAAVPLHARDYGRPGEGEAHDAEAPFVRCWFSDGGITSNFPISAFDAPLPSRPTFCVNLSSATGPRAEAVAGLDPEARDDALVWMPPVDDRPHPPRLLAQLRTPWDFVGAIVATARNAHENELMLMPGYRDRIVEVSTLGHEGGLNVAMPAATIEALSRRGARAAVELRERFAPGTDGGWAMQRWVRFRSTMDAVERLLEAFARGWHAPAQGAEAFAELHARWADAHATFRCYPWADPAMAAAADRALTAFLDAAAALERQRESLGGRIFDRAGDAAGAAPRPPLDLKMRPTARTPAAPAGGEPAQGAHLAETGGTFRGEPARPPSA